MSWEALKWVLDHNRPGSSAETSAERLVLIEFANHADERGYTWPSTEFIASVCHLHRDTVARAIDALIVRRAIFRTKKRRGNTGQVKVYRMPKITYESHLETGTFKQGQRLGKAPYKRRTSHLRLGTNLESVTVNHEDKRLPSQKADLLSSSPKRQKISRPDLRRPTDTGEVWEYIYNGDKDHPEKETEALENYFNSLDDEEGERDIAYWLHMNERKGWEGVTDWHVHLKETFLRGWFPSQKRGRKRRNDEER